MSDFSRTFRTLRVDSNLSQQELAEQLGISKSTVSLYEHGKREPNLALLEQIADFFDISMDYLLGRTQKETCCQVPKIYFDTNEYTADELNQISQFAAFIRSKRK